MTVDEVPSGIYLYPEEESGTDNVPSPVSTRYSSALIEEGRKEILKLMGIEVCFFIPVFFLLSIHKRQRVTNDLIHANESVLSQLRCRNLKKYF